MDKKEIALLLTAIAAVDDRIDPDEPRIEAWTAILDKDMPLEFARDLMIKHYANTTKPMMPADFNSPWRNFRERSFDRQWFEELDLRKSELSPEIKELIASSKEKLKQRAQLESPEKNKVENEDLPDGIETAL